MIMVNTVLIFYIFSVHVVADNHSRFVSFVPVYFDGQFFRGDYVPKGI